MFGSLQFGVCGVHYDDVVTFFGQDDKDTR